MDAYRTTEELEPALVERLDTEDGVLDIKDLEKHDALILIRSRLDAARPRNSTSGDPSSDNENGRTLFPFPDDVPFSPRTRSNPRRLVKACSSAISAARDDTPLPFSEDYLKGIEDRLFAVETDFFSDDPGS